ncbi:hypothetical protein HBH67_246810 [Parastagonospora nodorum]|nr:hypothetical protein HBH67_246810 [Parastagonospora nodorum]KAH4750127.1 hypothetical protein HBH63_245880 [Parastagonospora nodorum]
MRDDLAIEYKDISSLNYTQFIQTLKREVRRYASSNKETPTLLRTKHCCYAVYLLNIEEHTVFYAIELVQPKHEKRRYIVYLLIFRGLENSASASLLVYSDYALQKCSLLTLIGIVLYNAIKEYYNDRIRKIIYFYGYTIENKCRTSYSNKKDIEANEREDKFTILAEKYIIDNCIIYALALIKDE